MGFFKERHLESQEEKIQELEHLARCYALEPSHDDSLFFPNFEAELGPLRCHERRAVRWQEIIRLIR